MNMCGLWHISAALLTFKGITRSTGTLFREEGLARLTVAGNVHMPSSMKKVAARPDDGLQ